MDLFLFLCLFLSISYGLTLIITQSVIFEPLRDYMDRINPNFLGILFSCVMCTGFWIGLFLSILLNPVFPFMLAFIPFKQFIVMKVAIYLISMVLCGALASGSCWTIDTIVQYMDTQTELAELEKLKIKYDMLLKSDSESGKALADGILLEILQEEA